VITDFIKNPIGNIITDVFGESSDIVFNLAKTRIIETVNSISGTFVRATTATVEDHEDVIREVLSGEVRYQGQRRVHNFLPNSEDFTGWNKINVSSTSLVSTPFGIATKIVANGTIDPRIEQNVNLGAETLAGKDTLWSVSLWTDSGQPTDATLFLYDASIGDIETVDLTLTTTPQRFSIPNSFASSEADTNVIVRIDLKHTADSGDYIYAQWGQLQNKTGASDPTVPDSYVSTGVLSTPYHGANVDGVKYFLTTNGNSVASNVVTQAAGTPITDAIGYFGEPASTNKCTNYNANPASGAFAPTSVTTFNTNTTNLTAFDGGTGALFGVVDGSVAIAAAGLDAICPSGLLFKIDNSGGSGTAFIDISGIQGMLMHTH
jgi:hypothetical protein